MNKLLILIFCVFVIPVNAQKKVFTMEDAVLNLKGKLAPQNLKHLAVVPGKMQYVFQDTLKGTEVLKVSSSSPSEGKVIISLTDLNKSLAGFKEKELKTLPALQWVDSENFRFISGNTYYQFNIITKKAIVLLKHDEKAENTDYHASSNQMAYTVENNLFIVKGTEKPKPITAETNPAVVCGQAAHRNEFGIHKGTFWSKGGKYLAYYKMDQTMVEDYPVIDWSVKPAKAKNIKYPMAGMKSHEVRVAVYDVSSGKTWYLNTGEPADQYLTNISWTPDDKYILIAQVNREQNFMRLNCYEAATGTFVKTLFTEQDEKYVEPMHPALFMGDDASRFIWQSRRNGFNHLYLYDIQGNLIQPLTSGAWEVLDVPFIDPKGEKLYMVTTAVSPLNRDLYELTIKNKISKRLTSGDGTHTCIIGTDGRLLLDNFQSLTIPREIRWIDPVKGNNKTLFIAENPLKEYQMARVHMINLKAKDGQDLYARMYRPENFDSTKKYPVIVYLYGGPHAQMIQNNWVSAREGWFNYMAQRGYLVFTVDGRGSDNRGKAFEQATFRKLGSVEMDDQLEGYAYLIRQPYVDQNRIGVHGWSFGGFLTTSLMTRRPGMYKVGVAGGPVIDWSFYEVMYTERYMDSPKENKAGYDENNLLNYIDQLKGKLLLIHGTDDDVVVWQHSLMYIQKSVELGKQVDYYVYPGHKHNVLGKDRVHLMQKITDYFMQNL